MAGRRTFWVNRASAFLCASISSSPKWLRLAGGITTTRVKEHEMCLDILGGRCAIDAGYHTKSYCKDAHETNQNDYLLGNGAERDGAHGPTGWDRAFLKTTLCLDF